VNVLSQKKRAPRAHFAKPVKCGLGRIASGKSVVVTDFWVDQGDAVLAGSLTLPARAPAPALVAVHGAEAAVRSYPLYEHLHSVLPEAGFAAVTFDRRGEGESTGEPSAGRFELLAEDALAVVAHVAALPEIDAERIGLWGISQGGWVAPLAATRSSRVAFLVLVASAGVSPAEQMRWAVPRQLRLAGYGEEAVSLQSAARAELEEVIHSRGSAERAQELLDAGRASRGGRWRTFRTGSSTRRSGADGSRRWTSSRNRSSPASGSRRC
jgi:uncharacterized protein